MYRYAIDFEEIDGGDVGVVGGKGASLGMLSRIEGVCVPEGFCVSTEAFRQVVGAAPQVRGLLDRLAALRAEEREAIEEVAGALRGAIEGLAIPEEVRAAIVGALARRGAEGAWAVRSSATAEDLPGASFAGQQDTFLNVVGEAEVLRCIGRCWASLFTARAVAYRLQQGFDHREVGMGVVVQRMVRAQAAGVLFTADPVSGSRRVASIEATFGLGEALVAGRASADAYRVRGAQIIERAIATKGHAVWALEGGGTQEQAIEAERQGQPVLADAQVLRLVELGRRIEGHLGQPQDIEWCLVDEALHIVQSRPITTLYPIPERDQPGNRVYISVGHQQMMTDAMRPLGLSLFRLTAARPMYAAGGRLFVDVTRELSSPASRAVFLNMLGRAEPLLQDALTTLIERGDFIEAPPEEPSAPGGGPGGPHGGPPGQLEDDPAIVTDLIARSQASIEALRQDIQGRSGAALLEFILGDIQQLKQRLFEPQSFGAIMAGMNAAAWLNERLMEWLGERSAADALSQSVPNNVTSEMGLALLDVADAIRPHAEVIAYLEAAKDEGFLEGLLPLAGGPEAHAALRAWLDRYGMRCVGEIDLTRPRWSEAPATLAPLLLNHIKRSEPGAAQRRFEQGQREAAAKEQALLERLRQLPDGEQKAEETQRMIRRLRIFTGYREYPKHSIISRYFIYKQALLEEADRLVQAGVLSAREELFDLTFEELGEVVRTQALDGSRIRARKAEHAGHRRLRPPRVLTSDGEIIAGRYRREGLPAGALVGLAVSAGVVEGRARVLLDMADAALEAGDILVTPFTDPGWTPAFVSIRGLVTEVGGLMTHGAVIAREYGLPAVVGVQDATRLIQDGQRIRVHGGEGWVEVLA